MAPPKAAGDDNSIRVRRLKYRAAHRGTRELDLLLGPFAAAHAAAMSGTELDAFEALLETPETELQSWLLGQGEPPADTDAELLRRILDFKLTTVSP
jgi:antitoxin CptB